MSSNKTTKQLRRYNEYKIILNYQQLHQSRFGYVPKTPGKFRKQNPFNCGIPRCWLCANPRRLSGAVTKAERMADLELKEFGVQY